MLLPQEIESSKFKNIYDKNLPDKNVEFFWYNFKESVVNTLHSLTKETKILLKKSKEKVAQIVRILDKYKELYSIQMYLRSISLKKIFQDKNTGKNKNSGVDNELKNKMVYLMTEIDGAITRLESFMNERIDDSKMNTDNFSNVKNKYKFFIIF